MLLDYNADITIKNLNNKTAGEEAYDKSFFDISEKICEVEQKLMGSIIQECCDENDEDIDISDS
jgi:hypothetical protein